MCVKKGLESKSKTKLRMIYNETIKEREREREIKKCVIDSLFLIWKKK